MQNKPSSKFVPYTIALALSIGGVVYLYGHKTAEAPEDVPEAVSITSESVSSSTEKGATAPKTSALPVSPKSTTQTIIASGKLAPELQNPSGFSNTEQIYMRDFIGKNVVLVNFWTNSSVHALRTIPYLNQWYAKYKKDGLVVISVHTPRFSFERSKDNVDKAAYAYGMIHPIMLDNQYSTWLAWGNTEWPTQYLVDINGKIAYAHVGEGDYQLIESKINSLLVARNKMLKLPSVAYAPFEVPAKAESIDIAKIKSPEVLFGTMGNSLLANGTPLKIGMQDMKPFSTVKLNALYLSGSWDITKDYAKSAIADNRIVFKYNAKNVYAVLGSLKMSVVRITLDGKPLGNNAGKDVRMDKDQSYIYVTEERIYDIVRGLDYGEHTIEMVAETSGLEAFALTFG